ncbi:MAG: hypothetical protein KC609_18375 [Myxococcales bacterium]|nr:hypothetical protein [Myxococcales bacterium]
MATRLRKRYPARYRAYRILMYALAIGLAVYLSVMTIVSIYPPIFGDRTHREKAKDSLWKRKSKIGRLARPID